MEQNKQSKGKIVKLKAEKFKKLVEEFKKCRRELKKARKALEFLNDEIKEYNKRFANGDKETNDKN
jgi:flagellar biosynthesis chaperone FliJ